MKILFLIKIDDYSAAVIQEIVLNFSLYLPIILNGACLSNIHEVKKSFGMIYCYCFEVLKCEANLAWVMTCSITFVFLFGSFEKRWDAMKNCGKWSDVVAVTSLHVISYEIYLEEILLQRVFEWEVILFDWTM